MSAAAELPPLAVVGAGRVAAHLAPALAEAGLPITHVITRSRASAAPLAERVGAEPADSPAPLAEGPRRLVLLAVPDDALPGLAETLAGLLRPEDGVVHTAGSVPMDVLAPCAARRGVLYPLQSFSPTRAIDLRRVPFYLEATPPAEGLVQALGARLSDELHWLPSKGRLQLHTGAVFAANFVNLMLHQAGRIVRHETNLDYRVYLPLLQEVTTKLGELPPAEAQTGPAARGDTSTQQRHLALLEADFPELAELYRRLSEQIRALSQEEGDPKGDKSGD